MAEFTGERLVPGRVDSDLYNEHFARYQFACSLARGARMLDAGCGLGYGTAELAASAEFIIGVDCDHATVRTATEDHATAKAEFLTADVQDLPFAEGIFDCSVSFEVIEHLHQPERLLRALSAVTKPSGLVVLSTPNRDLYDLSRGEAGPNPYHYHEFSLEEFSTLLGQYFAHTLLFAQNHTPCISFRQQTGDCARRLTTSANTKMEGLQNAQFFVAICSQKPIREIDDFLYVAAEGNVLFEREKHIRLLTDELSLKNRWLEESQTNLHKLHEAQRRLLTELEERSGWATGTLRELEQINTNLANELHLKCEELQTAVDCLHRTEALLVRRTTAAESVSAQLEDKCQELKTAVDQLHATEAALADRTDWAMRTTRQLEDDNKRLADELACKCAELEAAVTHLSQAEATVVERTEWAQSLNQRLSLNQEQLSRHKEQIEKITQSSLFRIGRILRLVPDRAPAAPKE